jgi:hypothetical protein
MVALNMAQELLPDASEIGALQSSLEGACAKLICDHKTKARQINKERAVEYMVFQIWI